MSHGAIVSPVIHSLGNNNAYNITTYKEYSSKNKPLSVAIKPVPKSDVNLAAFKRKRKSSSG